VADSRLKTIPIPAYPKIREIALWTMPDLHESDEFNRVNIYLASSGLGGGPEGFEKRGEFGTSIFFLTLFSSRAMNQYHGYRHTTNFCDGSQELVVAQLQQGGAPVCVEIV
jgi:hypothetical protein